MITINVTAEWALLGAAITFLLIAGYLLWTMLRITKPDPLKKCPACGTAWGKASRDYNCCSRCLYPHSEPKRNTDRRVNL
jgi:predicted amidophosphoribosyltransferase